MFNLIDYKCTRINTEDIVKSENLETGQVHYYLCGKTMLYLYNEQGDFLHESFRNIKLDTSVTLVNDNIHRWTRLGTEAEVYDDIF